MFSPDAISELVANDPSPAASPLRRARKRELAAYAMGGAPAAESPGGMLLDASARAAQMVRRPWMLAGGRSSNAQRVRVWSHLNSNAAQPCALQASHASRAPEAGS
jgi:hypothetical protein